MFPVRLTSPPAFETTTTPLLAAGEIVWMLPTDIPFALLVVTDTAPE